LWFSFGHRLTEDGFFLPSINSSKKR
jgi:hypothetical protein